MLPGAEKNRLHGGGGGVKRLVELDDKAEGQSVDHRRKRLHSQNMDGVSFAEGWMEVGIGPCIDSILFLGG